MTASPTPSINYSTTIASELKLNARGVQAAIDLLDDGNTIPFIARYRKEATGGIDDEQLRQVADRLTYLRNLQKRKEEVIAAIEEQEKLTDDLHRAIATATTLQQVDDLYRPFRPRRATRASRARERGLEPLADWLRQRPFVSLPSYNDEARRHAEAFVDEQKEVPDVDAALLGAKDIIAEIVSDDPALRDQLRGLGRRSSTLQSTMVQKKDTDDNDKSRDDKDAVEDASAASVYDTYKKFEQRFSALRPHQVLAINRGEKEGHLRVTINIDEAQALAAVEKALFNMIMSDEGSPRQPGVKNPHLVEAAHDAWKRLLKPSTETSLRNELTEKAEEQAIAVFGANLRSLLLLPPLKGHVVLSLDPGYRTGCKIAVVDATGKLLETDVVYPHAPRNDTTGAEKTLRRLIDKHAVTVVAVGNGTASRETEQLVATLIQKDNLSHVNYAIVDEAGASVYSASSVAREEFPDLDVSERSAVSIARRLQDPLAELVKIDPKSIGVGQYQHDVDARQLESTLEGVVEGAVNTVGVDVNTASGRLLSYVAGLGPSGANNIVAHRNEQGPFRSRRELLKVPRLGPKTFKQCAGFLRIVDGDNPLDATPIHPESYDIAETFLARLGNGEGKTSLHQLTPGDVASWAQRLDVGVPTLTDIVEALKRPGRDPREDAPTPILRQDVLTIDDLTEGMQMQGTVRNVTDFGAFVDIGVGQDGLVHISEMADRFVQHPLDVVQVGDVVTVRVVTIDVKRRRIGLSMKGV